MPRRRWLALLLVVCHVLTHFLYHQANAAAAGVTSVAPDAVPVTAAIAVEAQHANPPCHHPTPQPQTHIPPPQEHPVDSPCETGLTCYGLCCCLSTLALATIAMAPTFLSGGDRWCEASDAFATRPLSPDPPPPRLHS